MSNRKKVRNNGVSHQRPQPNAALGHPQPNGASQFAQLSSVSVEEIWSAPLPSPSDLEHYERTLPGAASRIIALLEERAVHVQGLEIAQSEHRQELEKKIVTGTERRANIGQWTAYSIAIFGLLIGGGSLLTNHAVQGAVIVGSVFASGTVIWVLGGRPPKRQDVSKSEA